MSQVDFNLQWQTPGALEHEQDLWLKCPWKPKIAQSVINHCPDAKRVIDYCGGTGVQLRRLYEAGYKGDSALLDKSEECLFKYKEWIRQYCKANKLGGCVFLFREDVRDVSIEYLKSTEFGWKLILESGLFDVALWTGAQKHIPLHEVWQLTEQLAKTARYFGLTIYWSDTGEDFDDSRNSWPHVALCRNKWAKFVEERGWQELDRIDLCKEESFLLYRTS